MNVETARQLAATLTAAADAAEAIGASEIDLADHLRAADDAARAELAAAIASAQGDQP